MQVQEGSVTHCPSSMRYAELADKVIQEFTQKRDDFGLKVSKESTPLPVHQNPEEENTQKVVETKNDDEFEFAFVCRDHETLTADEMFSNGRIRPSFPVFNQDVLLKDLKRRPLAELFSEEQYSSSGSSSPESDTVQPFPGGRYCINMPKGVAASPSPRRWKKCNSTGTSNRWRLKNLMSRSNSDCSKQTIVFVARSGTKTVEESKKKISSGRGNGPQKMTTTKKGTSEQTVKSAHEIHYMRNRVLKEVVRHQTFLPYKTDIIGFFAKANTLSRTYHPF